MASQISKKRKVSARLQPPQLGCSHQRWNATLLQREAAKTISIVSISSEG
jgi:hypothetical protein